MYIVQYFIISFYIFLALYNPGEMMIYAICVFFFAESISILFVEFYIIDRLLLSSDILWSFKLK